MFCPNCGKQVPEGSAFCGSCGARLDGSAPPPAGGPQQGYQQAGPQQPRQPSAAAVAVGGLLPFLKGYLTAPINAAKELMAKRDMATAVILLAIQAIVSGLVIFSLFSKICSMIKSLGGTDLMDVSIGPSFIMSLIWGIVAAVVAIALFTVVLFAVARLMKSSCTVQDVLILCGAHSVFVTALLLLSFILFFLNIWLGAIAFSAAMIAWMVMGVVTAQTVTPDIGSGKFWMLLIAAVLVAQLVGGFVASKCVGGAIEAVSISAEGRTFTVGQLIDIGQLAFDDMMERFLGGF